MKEKLFTLTMNEQNEFIDKFKMKAYIIVKKLILIVN